MNSSNNIKSIAGLLRAIQSGMSLQMVSITARTISEYADQEIKERTSSGAIGVGLMVSKEELAENTTQP